jgi:hypothetical protein
LHGRIDPWATGFPQDNLATSAQRPDHSRIDGSRDCQQGNEESPPDMERSMKLVWLAAAFFALVIAPLQAQERKEVTVKELLSTTVTSSGQPIVLPQKDAQIVVSIYDVAPDADMFYRGSCG